MQRTVSLRLVNPPKDELRCTMNAFREACETLSAFIQQGAPINRGRLHRRYYKLLRNKFKLPSQMAQSVIRLVVGAYHSKRSKGVAPRFRRPHVLFQYNRDWSFSRGLVSLRTLTTRKRLQFQVGLYQQKKYFGNKAWTLGGARLIERNGSFFLNISLHKETKTLQKPLTAIGVDMGIRVLASARTPGKTPLIVRGGKLTAYREKMVLIRRRLQAKGTRSARRLLRHLRHREKRFVLDFCRKTAKQILQYAIRNDSPVLVFEKLTGIRARTRRLKKKNRRPLHTWPFLLLKRIIMEGTEEMGIPIVSVNPAYTSQRCPRCGTIAKHYRRRDSYQCRCCRYQNNADVVAATNLAWLWFNGVNRIESGVLSTTQTYRVLKQNVKYKPPLHSVAVDKSFH